MKILYVAHSRVPSDFANSIRVIKMCQAFKRNGHEVIMMARPGSGRFKDADLSEYYVSAKGLISFKAHHRDINRSIR